MKAPCSCGQAAVTRWPVLHHMPCAYVGPSYDFTAGDGGYTCPKCDLAFKEGGRESEILGYARKCMACGTEWLEDDTA